MDKIYLIQDLIIENRVAPLEINEKYKQHRTHTYSNRSNKYLQGLREYYLGIIRTAPYVLTVHVWLSEDCKEMNYFSLWLIFCWMSFQPGGAGLTVYLVDFINYVRCQ